MKKEIYSAPMALVIELAKEDIVTLSGDNFYDEDEI